VGYKIDNPIPGQWQAVVEILIKGPRKYEVVASGDSQISLELILLDTLQRDQTTGQEVPIRALLPVGLSSLAQELANASVSVVAEVTAPDGVKTLVPMYDDGQHNAYDQAAGDGLWAGVYTLVNQASAVDQFGEDNFPLPSPPKDQSAYQVVVNAAGADFSRQAKGSFAVLEGADTGGDGVPDVYIEQYGAPNADPDLDSLLTADEYFAGTNPLHSDSDTDDGVLRESDWSEVQNAQDPLDPADDQILAPEYCQVLGQNGEVVIEYDVKPAYDQLRLFRRPDNGLWNFHTALPINTGGIFTDTINVTNGVKYEYQINAVDGTHVSAQVMCGIASPEVNWRPPEALLMLDNGYSTPDLTVALTFYPYEDDDEGILNFNEIVEMRLSNSPDFIGAVWEPFQATGKLWQLDPSTPSGSIATVYAELRNVDGTPAEGPAIGNIRYLPPTTIYLPVIIRP
jgi:hypothetical protein